MSTVPLNLNPTRRDVRIFAGLWLGFFMLMGWLAGRGGNGLVIAAAVTGVCVVASLAFNREWPKRWQLMGLGLPLLLSVLWKLGSVNQDDGGWLTASVAGLGVVGAVVAGVSERAGLAMYRGWMMVAAPIGWTISYVILALAFYAVVTPLGLAMRVISGDPMQRRFDRGARSYWLPRREMRESSRYFRQF